MSMRHLLKLRTAALVGFVVIAGFTAAGLAELKEIDSARLSRARTMHTQEIEKARAVYDARVGDPNKKLEVSYNAVIKQYEARNETDVVEALRAELAEATGPEASASSDKSSASGKSGMHQKLISMIGPELVTASGEKISSAQLNKVEHVLLYFSAGWCPPCRKFTPELVKFFDDTAESRNIMIVFVSSDRSENDLRKYMTDYGMKWVAVPFSRINASGITEHSGGTGIPSLVWLNTDGTVRSGSYVDGKYVGPNKVLNDVKAALAEAE